MKPTIARVLVCAAFALVAQASWGQSASAFDGVWGGYRNPSPFLFYSEFQFQTDGDRISGVWHTPNESLQLQGTIKGPAATGIIEGGGKFSLELLGGRTLKFKKLSFMGSKFELERLNKPFADATDAKALSTTGVEKSAAFGQISTMAASMANKNKVPVATALPIYSSKAGNVNETCNGYPIESRGDHPPGYTCRCTYGGPSNQLGWWAVQSGNPRSNVLACSSPRNEAAGTPKPSIAASNYGNGANASPPPAATASSFGRSYVPNSNRCIEFTPLKNDGITAWYRLTNRCSDSVEAHWCDSRGEQCSLNMSASLNPGQSYESWYNPDKFTGTSRMACPTTIVGKPVYLDAALWQCYVGK